MSSQVPEKDKKKFALTVEGTFTLAPTVTQSNVDSGASIWSLGKFYNWPIVLFMMGDLYKGSSSM